jgi:hypothetical protein
MLESATPMTFLELLELTVPAISGAEMRPLVPKAKGADPVAVAKELSSMVLELTMARIVAPDWMPAPVTGIPALNELVLLSPVTSKLEDVVFPCKAM